MKLLDIWPMFRCVYLLLSKTWRINVRALIKMSTKATKLVHIMRITDLV